MYSLQTDMNLAREIDNVNWAKDLNRFNRRKNAGYLSC